MSKHIPQSTRAIINTIKQLESLRTTLKSRTKYDTAAEGIKLKKALIDVERLISNLEDIAAKTTSRRGIDIGEAKEKLAAESVKRRSGQMTSTDVCEEPVVKSDNTPKDGVMVALYPSPVAAKRLAVEGGEPRNELHLTLLYFKDGLSEREDWDKLADVVEGVLTKHTRLKGDISGAGRFVQEEKDVAWASVNLKGLLDLRADLLAAAEKAGFEVRKDYEFNPHITLAYLGKEDPFPGEIQKFNAIFSKVKIMNGEKPLRTLQLKQR